MKFKTPKIYFYIESKNLDLNKLPNVEGVRIWQDKYYKNNGNAHWILQTYIHLKENNFPCEITKKMPNEGILLAHKRYVPDNLQIKKKLMPICIKVDKKIHPSIDLHIVHNPLEGLLSNNYYIPPWPQCGLIPRNKKRKDIFKNIAFMGWGHQLTEELKEPSFNEKLRKMGLNFKIVDDVSGKWHDFNEVDAILAVRSFKETEHKNKSILKLINAWTAGVPAILGKESAFGAVKKNKLDYIEVGSLNDVFDALRKLKENKNLRREMIENGFKRAKEFSPAQTIEKWKTFFNDIAIPKYYEFINKESENNQKK